MVAIQRRTARAIRRPLDQATAAAGMARPGQDTRQWISYGLVASASNDPKDIVDFDEDFGAPLVTVTLQPSDLSVRCRVGSQIAGNGEGEWHPFVKNDEVLVAIPEGDEKAGPVIICRLNNAYDKFPMDSVAGQDPTTNTFAFRRRRTPHIEEFAGPIMFRTAPTGAFLSIDLTGAITLRDGEGDALQMTPDVFGYQSADTKNVLQMNNAQKQFILQVGDAYFQISATDSPNEINTLMLGGPFALMSSGNPALEHVATAESVVSLFASLLQVFGPPLGLIGPAMDAVLAGLVTAAANGGLAATPLTAAAIAAAFAAATQKPATGAVQLRPGLGCAGFLVG